MSERTLALVGLGLVIVAATAGRIGAAALTPFPQPEDTAYYVGVGRNILEGRGLVSDAIWSYHSPPLAFPREAFEIWLPLPTFIALLPQWLAGIGSGAADLVAATRAAQVMSVAAGLIVCVLAWRLGADVAAERGLPPGRAAVLATGAGLASAAYLPLVLHAALPDSTMVFAVLVLGSCLLMTRVLGEPRGARWTDARLLAIGLLLGLGALTRNEVVWLALVWAILAWRAREPATGERLARSARVRLVAGTAVVALVVFLPWAIRNWLTFGSPLPGQALSNALFVSGTDVFAWADPPSLSRYLEQGLGPILGARVTGLLHNLLNVLVYLGVPLSVVGLAALPWTGRGAALRPLLLFAVVTFLVASLVFPVATTWGTFLHAAGAIHVLLVISALLALDGLIVRVGRVRGWTRPVAWLGPAFAVAGAALFSVMLLPSFGAVSTEVERRYSAIGPMLADAGLALDPASPVITDFPIWLAETWRQPSLALPDEPPSSALDLARAFPGTRTVLVFGGLGSDFVDGLADGAADTACFEEVALAEPVDPADAAAVDGVRAWRIVCS